MKVSFFEEDLILEEQGDLDTYDYKTLKYVPELKNESNLPPDEAGVATVSVSYKTYVVVFPWADAALYPRAETYDDNVFQEGQPYILHATDENGKSVPSGMVHIARSKRKVIGGSLVIDWMGKLDNGLASIGTWAALVTTHLGSGSEPPTINQLFHDPNYVVKFIGQVYSVNSSHFADANGARRRVHKVTLREWGYALSTPGAFNATAVQMHLTAPATLAVVQKAIDEMFMSGQVLKEIGTKMYTIFGKCLTALAVIGAASKNNSAMNQEIKPLADKIGLFSETIARLPAVPQSLTKSLYEESGSTSASLARGSAYKDKKGLWVNESAEGYQNSWSTRFARVLSGVWRPNIEVGDWYDPLYGQGYTASKYIAQNPDKFLIFDTEENKRGLSMFDITNLLYGESVMSVLEGMCRSTASTEVYTELLHYIDKDNTCVVYPTIVVRDMPYSLTYFKKLKNNDLKVPWTYMDDLPRTSIWPRHIVSLDTTKTMDGCCNLFIPGIMTGNSTDVASQNDAFVNAAVSIPSMMSRFGTITRNVGMVDFLNTTSEKSPPTSKENVAKAADSNKKDTKAASKLTISPTWYKALAAKIVEFDGHRDLFYTGTLKIKDAGFRISVGNNISFKLNNNGPTYVAHVEGIEERYKIDNGLTTCETYIYFSRMCWEGIVNGKRQLYPMLYLKRKDENLFTYSEQKAFTNGESVFNEPPIYGSGAESVPSVESPTAGDTVESHDVIVSTGTVSLRANVAIHKSQQENLDAMEAPDDIKNNYKESYKGLKDLRPIDIETLDEASAL